MICIGPRINPPKLHCEKISQFKIVYWQDEPEEPNPYVKSICPFIVQHEPRSKLAKQKSVLGKMCLPCFIGKNGGWRSGPRPLPGIWDAQTCARGLLAVHHQSLVSLSDPTRCLGNLFFFSFKDDKICWISLGQIFRAGTLDGPEKSPCTELAAVSHLYAYFDRIYNAGKGFLPSTVSPNLFVECIPVSQCQECEDREGTLTERKKGNFSSHRNPGFQQTKTTNPWPFWWLKW